MAKTAQPNNIQLFRIVRMMGLDSVSRGTLGTFCRLNYFPTLNSYIDSLTSNIFRTFSIFSTAFKYPFPMTNIVRFLRNGKFFSVFLAISVNISLSFSNALVYFISVFKPIQSSILSKFISVFSSVFSSPTILVLTSNFQVFVRHIDSLVLGSMYHRTEQM